MNPRWLAPSAITAYALALPTLLALTSCAGLDPAASYRKAAKQLTFSLDQVEPSIQLAYPLEQSRLRLRLTLGVENPTTMHFRAHSITGGISLDSDRASHSIGQLNFSKGMDLKPAAHTPVAVDLSFTYNDLRTSWVALKNVGAGNRPGTWHLDGQVGLEVMGFPVNVPLRVQKHVSGH